LGKAGVTLIELMISLVVASVVIASIYQLMINQSRAYTDQREITDARETARGAAVLLSAELRQLSAADNDIYFVSSDSIAVRSVGAGGIVCDKDNPGRRYALWGTSGEITTDAADSALIFAAAGSGAGDDSWRAVDLEDSWSPGVAGMNTCSWAVAQVPDIVVRVSHDSDIVDIGAAFRLFRPVQYGIYQADGRWWLGRKVGGAVNYEKLTGPLLAPGANGGLELNYYDAAGAVTAVPTDVRTIEIIIRAQSFGTSRGSTSSDLTERQDSIKTKVFLRG
jgi:prepilin-type N-terminal cleavage/methylation domain-containing protein